MNELKELLSYVRSPSFIKNSQLPNKNNLRKLGILLCAEYLLSIVWILTVNRWIKANYNIDRSEMTEEQLLGSGLLLFFISVAILYPIVEELIFRYFLKGRPIIIYVLSGLAIGGVAYMLTKEFHFPTLLIKRIALLASAFGPLIILTYFYVKSLKKKVVEKRIAKNFPLIFYGSTLAFAAVHIANFDWTGNYILVIPFIVPQLLSGFLYGYARMKFGLWASILLHGCSNSITFVFDKILGL